MSRPTHHGADGRDAAAAAWCLRLAEAPLDDREGAALDDWLDADAANVADLERAVAIWQGIDGAGAMPEMLGYRVGAVEALRRANERRWSARSARRWQGRPAVGRWIVAGSIAASLIAILVIATMLLSDPTLSYRTGIGERRVVLLDDGTRVALDGNSRVDVRFDRDRRRLELVSGRAKFDVAHDPLRPLSVLARNRLTVATGTSFSVELLPRQVRVLLYEGKVDVMTQPRDGARAVMLERGSGAGSPLKPGRELIVSTDSLNRRVERADVGRSQSWESGVLTFAGEPLGLAVERINRGAATPLIVADRRVASLPVSGVFAIGDVDAFVEGVSAIYPVEAVRDASGVMLKRKDDRRSV